jgi:thiol-disulfide isomerase/thioredoxin
MALTPSNMIPLGTIAPSFQLWDVRSDKKLSLAELKSPVATVIMFICNHCPYVKHILPELIDVAKQYQQKGISFIAINSNDVENYPEDSPEKMRAEAHAKDFTFPYLYDETQEVARAYQAACTPDFYVFDKELKCVYRGRFDDASPGNNIPVTGEDLRRALDNLLLDSPVNTDQKNSIGCNIKWKKI